MKSFKPFITLHSALLVALLAAPALADPVAGELTFTLTQQSRADGKIDVSLLWSTEPNANRCVSSGDWTGGRNVDRTTPLVITGVTPPKSYVLTCSWDDTDVVLSWQAPTQNEDGSALTNLASYRIYYGTDPAALSQQVAIANPATLTHTITNLAAGVYYFEMTAINSAGGESKRSARVQATLGSADKAITRTLEQKVPLPPGGVVANP